MARTTTTARTPTSTKRTRGGKDAIAFLKEDHKAVRKLLEQLEGSSSRSAKRRTELLERIATEVEAHAKIEEELFYPAFRERGRTKDDEKLFLEAAEEHRLVHVSLPELQSTDPATELFSARAKVLKDLIEHHAEEEERELFPRAKQLMGADELRELGTRLEARKQELVRGVRSEGE